MDVLLKYNKGTGNIISPQIILSITNIKIKSVHRMSNTELKNHDHYTIYTIISKLKHKLSDGQTI